MSQRNQEKDSDGKEAFTKRKELLKGGFNRDLKKRMVKSLGWSVTLYADEDDVDWKGGWQTDRCLRDVDMEEDGEDQLDRTQNECRSIEKVEEERSLMDIIRTRQKNWIELTG